MLSISVNPLYTGMGFRVKTKKIHQPVLFIFGKKDEALDYRMVPFMEVRCILYRSLLQHFDFLLSFYRLLFQCVVFSCVSALNLFQSQELATSLSLRNF